MAQWLDNLNKNLKELSDYTVKPLCLYAVIPFSGCKNINKNEIYEKRIKNLKQSFMKPELPKIVTIVFLLLYNFNKILLKDRYVNKKCTN
jgi:hypothetical protein